MWVFTTDGVPVGGRGAAPRAPGRDRDPRPRGVRARGAARDRADAHADRRLRRQRLPLPRLARPRGVGKRARRARAADFVLELQGRSSAPAGADALRGGAARGVDGVGRTQPDGLARVPAATTTRPCPRARTCGLVRPAGLRRDRAGRVGGASGRVRLGQPWASPRREGRARDRGVRRRLVRGPRARCRGHRGRSAERDRHPARLRRRALAAPERASGHGWRLRDGSAFRDARRGRAAVWARRLRHEGRGRGDPARGRAGDRAARRCDRHRRRRRGGSPRRAPRRCSSGCVRTRRSSSSRPTCVSPSPIAASSASSSRRRALPRRLVARPWRGRDREDRPRSGWARSSSTRGFKAGRRHALVGPGSLHASLIEGGQEFPATPHAASSPASGAQSPARRSNRSNGSCARSPATPSYGWA